MPLDEEVMTNALFGIFFDAMSWVVAMHEDQAKGAPPCKWGSYRKYRSSDTKKTERYSGADFAFLVMDGPAHVRLALFQAKKGYRTDPENVAWVLPH